MAHPTDENNNSHDHSEVLNGKLPSGDARLINDILHNNDSIDERDPCTPIVETYAASILTTRTSVNIPPARAHLRSASLRTK